MISATALARTAFLSLGRQAWTLHSTHLPTFTSLPTEPTYLRGPEIRGPPWGGPPRTLLKSSQNLLNPSENLLKPLQTRSEPPKTSQNLQNHQNTRKTSPGTLPELSRTSPGPPKFNIFGLQTLKFNIVSLRTLKCIFMR